MESQNLKLYYEIQGKGPRLLFIPGTASDLRQHPNFFDSPLAKHFEILSFDQRGIGQSNSPDPEPTMRDYAHDIKILLDYLGWNTRPIRRKKYLVTDKFLRAKAMTPMIDCRN